MPTESLCLWEKDFAWVNNSDSKLVEFPRRWTLCIFLSEHMVSERYTHTAQELNTAERLSPHTPGVRNKNVYPNIFTLRCTTLGIKMWSSNADLCEIMELFKGLKRRALQMPPCSLCSFSTVCQPCKYELCYIPPDGLVNGGTEDQVVVLGEVQTGHTFVVCMFKPAQTQTALDIPHLDKETHTFLREKMMILPFEQHNYVNSCHLSIS